MIKNIIFDVGQVLLNYRPLDYLKSLGYDNKKSQELNDLIFDNPLWNEIDRGIYSFQEYKDYLKGIRPELSNDIDKVFNENWMDLLTPKEETVVFLKELIKKNFKIYLLSNFSVEGFEFVESKYDFLKMNNGKVVSGYINLIKPDDEIYRYTLDKFNIDPTESVFIDDNLNNILKAKQFGINTIHFTEINSCINQFEEIIEKTKH